MLLCLLSSLVILTFVHTRSAKDLVVPIVFYIIVQIMIIIVMQVYNKYLFNGSYVLQYIGLWFSEVLDSSVLAGLSCVSLKGLLIVHTYVVQYIGL